MTGRESHRHPARQALTDGNPLPASTPRCLETSAVGVFVDPEAGAGALTCRSSLRSAPVSTILALNSFMVSLLVLMSGGRGGGGGGEQLSHTKQESCVDHLCPPPVQECREQGPGVCRHEREWATRGVHCNRVSWGGGCHLWIPALRLCKVESDHWHERSNTMLRASSEAKQPVAPEWQG